MKQRDLFLAGAAAGAVIGAVGWLVARYAAEEAIPCRPLSVGEPFPTVVATTLPGKRLLLPDDLAGSVGLLVIGFDYDARFQIDAWVRHATELYGEQPSLHILQVAAVGKVAPFMRAMINAAMERGTPEWERPQVVTLYGDLREMRTRLLVDDPIQAQVVLLGRTGRVAWKTTGPLTEDRKDALREMLEAQGITVHWKPA